MRQAGAVILIFMLLAARPSSGAEPMGAQAFDAHVTGRTLTYAHQGRVYGMEQYMPGRQVVWRQLGGPCHAGTWFESGDQICFRYEGDLPLQCWQFFRDGGRLGARAAGDPEGLWLYEVEQTDAPMQCPAPYLGS